MLPPDLADQLRALSLVVFDFDGVFTDNAVWVFEDGREAVRCSRLDGIGLSALRGLGIELAIISTEVNPAVQARARKLKLRCINACEDKRTAIKELARELDVDLAATAFVGNDINDIPALSVVGLPIVVADAHEDVFHMARLRTRRSGGHGAVRELCDLIVAAHAEKPALDRGKATA
jgi:YrbI family 3-deoxy-D-manno-octulosonate 8-phosphate phosphatase